jgi:hypothetical protein
MTSSASRALLPAVLASLVLAACGQDPAPVAEAPASAPAPAAAAPAAPAVVGLKPVADDSLAAMQANGPGVKCNIETIDGESFEDARPMIGNDHAVKLVGWYAPAAPGAAQIVLANEDGSRRWKVALPALLERQDVAAALGNPAALASGINVDLDLSDLPGGFYNIYLSDAAHGAASACGLGRGFYVE